MLSGKPVQQALPRVDDEVRDSPSADCVDELAQFVIAFSGVVANVVRAASRVRQAAWSTHNARTTGVSAIR